MKRSFRDYQTGLLVQKLALKTDTLLANQKRTLCMLSLWLIYGRSEDNKRDHTEGRLTGRLVEFNKGARRLLKILGVMLWNQAYTYAHLVHRLFLDES